LKINKTILENMIREELFTMMEGLTPAEHADILRDPQAFADNHASTSAEIREAFFFPARLIGRGSKSGELFFKNYHIAKREPAMFKQLKINLAQAIADIGLGGIDENGIHIVQTSDGQTWLRVSNLNFWKKKPGSNPPVYTLGGRSAPILARLMKLDWGEKGTDGKQKYVTLPAGSSPMTKATRRRAAQPRVTMKYDKKSKRGGVGLADLWRSTLGTLNPLKR